MNIGLDGRLLNKRLNTGISRYTEFLLEYYIQKYGYDSISVITNDPLCQIGNCKMVYTNLRPYNLLHFFSYAKFIQTFNFDVFHIPFYSGFPVRLQNTKVIVTVHDLMYKLVKNFFVKNKLINYLKVVYFDFIIGFTIKNADVVVSVSETTLFDLNKMFNVNSIYIPENSEISGGIDELVLDKLDLRGQKFYFYCGNNRSHKNLQFVIDIFNSNPDLPPLVLAGKGHTNSNNVIAVGIVSEEELKALYQASIAFVFPSKYEGFGLPVLEALYVGTLVIASRIPAFIEFKSHNITYFDLDDAKQLLEALHKVENNIFIQEDAFFDKYETQGIHKRFDSIIASFF